MLDLATLHLISMVSFTGLLFATITLWRLVPQERSMRAWATAASLLALGMLLLGLRAKLPNLLSTVLAHTSIVLGIGYLLVGTRQLLGHGPGRSWHWLAAGIAILTCLVTVYIAPSQAIRSVVLSLLYLPFLLACAWLFWRGSEAGIKRLERIAALIFALGALLFLVRAMNPPGASVHATATSWSLTLPYRYAILFSMWMSVTLTLMVSVRLQHQRGEALERTEAANRELQESEFRWKFAIEGSGDGVWDWNIQSNEARYSRRWKEMLGYAEDDILPTNQEWQSRIHPDDRAYVAQSMQAYLEGKTAIYVVEYRLQCKDDSYKWILGRGMVVSRGEDGKPLRMIGTHVDITGRKQQEDLLRESEMKLRTLFETTSDAVMLLDESGFFDCNPATLRLFGCASKQEFATKHPADLSPPEQPGGGDSRHLAGQYIASAIENGSEHFEWTHQRLDDRQTFPADVLLNAMNINGRTVLQAVVRDIRERKRAEAKVRQLAFYDTLTDLPNRMLLNDRMQQALVAASRERGSVALMFLDLDHFKPINDSFGHDVGDKLLKEAASRILACLRESDTVARIGGDEFIVLLRSVQNAQDAVGVAEKICASLRQPFELAGERLQVSASIGIALYPEHGSTGIELSKNADIAMYQAKKAGRDRVKVFTSGELAEKFERVGPAGASIVRLSWKPAYASGDPSIDLEHRELFRLANNLLERALIQAQQPDHFIAAFDALLAHVVEHFSHEETMLRVHAYAHSAEHEEQHRALLTRALGLRRLAGEGGVSVGELVDFLVSEVISGHMLHADKLFFDLFPASPAGDASNWSEPSFTPPSGGRPAPGDRAERHPTTPGYPVRPQADSDSPGAQ